MSAKSKPKRASRVPGAKVLITASAVAATLAGWVSLTWKTSAAATGASSAVRAAEAQLASAALNLQPLPTLVPAGGQPRSGGSVPAQGGQQTVLRSVSAPPAPVTITQSSRP